MDKKYNGWTNYETWAVALWMDNDALSHRYWREAAHEARSEAPKCQQVTDDIWTEEQAARFLLADWIKEGVSEKAPTSEPSVYTDLLQAALDSVQWQEIADHLLEDTKDETPPNPERSNEPFEIVSTYTRAQALEDAVLIDVTKTAKEAGIVYPAAVTAAVWGLDRKLANRCHC